MPTSINLGKIRPVDKGEWSSTYEGGYDILDIVTSGKGSYMSKVKLNTFELTDRTKWIPLVDSAAVELAIQGANEAAAEADAARLAIEGDLALKADQIELSQLAGDVYEDKINYGVFETGHITTDGALYTTSGRARSSFKEAKTVKNALPEKYEMSLRYYSEVHEFIGADIVWRQGAEIDIEQDCAYIRITVKKIAESNFTVEEIAELNGSVYIETRVSLVEKLKDELSLKLSILDVIYEIGIISNVDGGNRPDIKRLRTSGYVSNMYQFQYHDVYQISRRYYDENKLFLSGDTVWQDEAEGDDISGYMRFIFRRRDDANITTADIYDIKQHFKVYTKNENIIEVEKIVNESLSKNIQKGTISNTAILPSLVLKCAYDMSYPDGTNAIAKYFLWHDMSLNFYVSNSHFGEKNFLFKWTAALPPSEYSMAILKNGDILCVWRSEKLTSGSDDNNRKNPILLEKNNDYKPFEIDFGVSLKPTSWLMQAGFFNNFADDSFMIAEYTRPSVTKACVWRVSGDVKNPSNWTIVKEVQLSGLLNSGFKHFHSVQQDPFSGHIYATSGDDDTAAAIYVSQDNGQTFTLLYGPNERYCRLINFVFTKDFVYWATDSGLPGKHSLFKIERDATTKVMDFSTVQILYDFPGISGSIATYATVYLETEDALVFLERADGGSTYIPVYVWDLTSSTFTEIDRIYNVTGTNMTFGFRFEYAQLFPRGNSFSVGFGYQLFGVSDNRNHLKLLGNSSGTLRINNLIITIKRVGSTFKATYNTVY